MSTSYVLTAYATLATASAATTAAAAAIQSLRIPPPGGDTGLRQDARSETRGRGRTSADQPITREAAQCCATVLAGYGANATPSRGRDLRARVPEWDGLAERRLPAHEHADGARRGAGRVLGLRARELAAHDALSEGVARALLGRRPAGDRHSLARVLVRARPRHRRGRGGAPRGDLPGAPRSRARGLAPLREHGLAGSLPVRPHRQARLHPLRRGRVPGDRAGDSGVRRGDPRAARPGAPRGCPRRPARAADGRHRPPRRPRAA